MHSKADEIKQIAPQLLAGMLANPHIYQVYPTESGQLSQGQQDKLQQEELIEKAIAMAEALIARAETKIESQFQHHLS